MAKLESTAFGYTFPAIRGIQAGREYFVSMCPLRLIPRIFLFDEEEVIPEHRAQRTLNKGRVPELSRYILENPFDYVFSALTASIDADIRFESVSKDGDGQKMGMLHVPMDAQFLINDGQHRRAAIEMALRERPELGNETISIVFFIDVGLERCQQMFADLNRHAVRPSRSLGLLYDHRDELARLVRNLVNESKFYRPLIETEKSTLSPRSRRLFTLSALHRSTKELLADFDVTAVDKASQFAEEYWAQMPTHFPVWRQVQQGRVSAGDVRREYLHTHGTVLQSIGSAGRALLQKHPRGWKRPLRGLRDIDWSRSNARLWEGRTMIGGRVAKSTNNVTLTTNVIKQALDLPLTPEEQKVEEAFAASRNGS